MSFLQFYGEIFPLLAEKIEKSTYPTMSNPSFQILEACTVIWWLRTHTPKNTHLSYGLINSPEGRLFAVVVNPSVPVQYVDALFFGRLAITAIDAMVWAIVPLARELQ